MYCYRDNNYYYYPGSNSYNWDSYDEEDATNENNNDEDEDNYSWGTPVETDYSDNSRE